MSANNYRSPNKPIPEEDNTDGLMSMTDSEDSSSSSYAHIFDNQALILELHELQKDEQQKEELPDNPMPEVKTRRLSKKRARRPDQSTANLSSSSECLVLSTVQDPGAEEYFDAQGSYDDLSGNSSASGRVSNVSIPRSQKEKSKTMLPRERQPSTNATLPPAAEQESAGAPPAGQPAVPTTDSNPTDTKPVPVDQPQPAQEASSKPESADTGAQPDAPTTTSQQTDISNPAQQQTGPLSKPTEPTETTEPAK